MRTHTLGKTIVIEEKTCGVSRATKSVFEFANNKVHILLLVL
jgi:hypothetical protein